MTGRLAATLEEHTVVLTELMHISAPTLYGAKCSCGWESDYVYSDPEIAETDGYEHKADTA